MQNTRLNILLNVVIQQLSGWLRNPWRRLSLILISLLFGFFLGTAISTLTGQRGNWDIVVAGTLLILVEGLNWLVYGDQRRLVKPLLRDLLNALKIGVTYSLFVDALKLGS